MLSHAPSLLRSKLGAWYTYFSMARKKLESRFTRKLGKTGGGRSISVTLPIELVRKLKWRRGQKVVVSQKGKNLIIKDWKKP